MTEHWFIVPPLDGPPSGGTLYNRELLSELSELGIATRAVEPTAALEALRGGARGCFWVDTLFLEQVPEVWRDKRSASSLGLIAHYLPALVERGDAVVPSDLGRAEAFALAHADAVLAPSVYMQRTLQRLGLNAAARCLIVEPGCGARGLGPEPTSAPGVRALLVANVTPGKGVEPFLAELGAELRESDRLELTIVGSLDAAADYAQRCAERVAQHPELARRVKLTGALSPAKVLERLAAANLLISASRMESFGMALAEARTLGVPIVAHAGGNAGALVEDQAGGALVDDDRALARACCSLARDPAAHRRALERARAHARPPRSFADAARDFVAQLSTSGLVRGP